MRTNQINESLTAIVVPNSVTYIEQGVIFFGSRTKKDIDRMELPGIVYVICKKTHGQNFL